MANEGNSSIAVVGGSNLTTLLRLAGVGNFYTIENDDSNPILKRLKNDWKMTKKWLNFFVQYVLAYILRNKILIKNQSKITQESLKQAFLSQIWVEVPDLLYNQYSLRDYT